jgi:hypothetical protein
MVRREIIQDGVRIFIAPFAKTANNARCKVSAEVVTRRGGERREARIFVQELDVRGMAISDAVLLMAAIRTIVAEAGGVVEEGKVIRAKKRLRQARAARKPVAKRKKK